MEILKIDLFICDKCFRLKGHVRERYNGKVPVYCICDLKDSKKKKKNPSIFGGVIGEEEVRLRWKPISDYRGPDGKYWHTSHFAGYGWDPGKEKDYDILVEWINNFKPPKKKTWREKRLQSRKDKAKKKLQKMAGKAERKAAARRVRKVSMQIRETAPVPEVPAKKPVIRPVILEPTHNTPFVKLSPDGEIVFKGRAYPEDAFRFYCDILSWAEDYVQNPAEKTIVSIRIEYMNDGTMKYLLYLLGILTELPSKGHGLEITWYYDKIDEDMKELTGFYEDILHRDFRIIPVEKI